MPPLQSLQSPIASTGLFRPPTSTIRVDTSGYRKPNTSIPNPNQYLKDILDKMGSTLKAPESILGKLSYDKFAAPQMETLRLFEQMNLRPEFERFTKNPFERNYANTAAAGNAMYAGNARRIYGDQNRKVEMGYADQVSNVQNQYEDMIRNMYNSRISKMGDSPTALTNI